MKEQHRIWKFNYLSLLSLLSAVSILALFYNNVSLYGFLGFLSYLRYYKIIPDELFIQNVRRAATAGFMYQMIAFIPAMLLGHLYYGISSKAIVFSLAIAFMISILVFSIYLSVLEHKESRT